MVEQDQIKKAKHGVYKEFWYSEFIFHSTQQQLHNSNPYSLFIVTCPHNTSKHVLHMYYVNMCMYVYTYTSIH